MLRNRTFARFPPDQFSGNPPLRRIFTGEQFDLRLFFDHSIIEVYANGLCSSGRWFPDAPSKIEVGFFSEDDSSTIDEIDIWELETIWQKYATGGSSRPELE